MPPLIRSRSSNSAFIHSLLKGSSFSTLGTEDVCYPIQYIAAPVLRGWWGVFLEDPATGCGDIGDPSQPADSRGANCRIETITPGGGVGEDITIRSLSVPVFSYAPSNGDDIFVGDVRYGNIIGSESGAIQNLPADMPINVNPLSSRVGCMLWTNQTISLQTTLDGPVDFYRAYYVTAVTLSAGTRVTTLQYTETLASETLVSNGSQIDYANAGYFRGDTQEECYFEGCPIPANGIVSLVDDTDSAPTQGTLNVCGVGQTITHDVGEAYRLRWFDFTVGGDQTNNIYGTHKITGQSSGAVFEWTVDCQPAFIQWTNVSANVYAIVSSGSYDSINNETSFQIQVFWSRGSHPTPLFTSGEAVIDNFTA